MPKCKCTEMNVLRFIALTFGKCSFRTKQSRVNVMTARNIVLLSLILTGQVFILGNSSLPSLLTNNPNSHFYVVSCSQVISAFLSTPGDAVFLVSQILLPQTTETSAWRCIWVERRGKASKETRLMFGGR